MFPFRGTLPRYPDDPLDRVWYADSPIYNSQGQPGTYDVLPFDSTNVSTTKQVAVPASMPNAVPQFVLRKARLAPQGSDPLQYDFYVLGTGEYEVRRRGGKKDGERGGRGMRGVGMSGRKPSEVLAIQ